VQRAQAEDVTEVARKQQHRGGSTSIRRSCPLGRVLEDHSYLCSGLSKTALWEAYNRFKAARAADRTTIDAKRPYANTSGTGRLSTPCDYCDCDPGQCKESDKIRSKWDSVFGVLQRAGGPAFNAIFAFMDNDPEQWVPPFWTMNAAIHGCVVLCKFYGLEYEGEDKERK
jgi:hypothetical protein